MWRRVILAVSLVAMTQRAIAQDDAVNFDSQEFIKQHTKVHEVFQSEFSEELPSCGKNFYSPEAVEKEAACFASDKNDSSICTPECVDSWKFNSIDCEADLIAFELSAGQRIVEAAKNGTMNAKDRKLVEALYMQLPVEGISVNVTEPGFLSTQEKAKEFFSSEANLELLDLLFLNNQVAGNQYLRIVAACTDPSSFDTESFIKNRINLREALQSGFSEELPSCGENAFSLQAAEKEAACVMSEILMGRANNDDVCTPECKDSFEFKGVDCIADLINLEFKLQQRFVDSAKKGTMDASERKLLQAYVLDNAFLDVEGRDPGFLSTEEKAKKFFSSESNIALLDDILLSSQEAVDNEMQAIQACVESQGAIVPGPSASSGISAKVGHVVLVAAVTILSLV